MLQLHQKNDHTTVLQVTYSTEFLFLVFWTNVNVRLSRERSTLGPECVHAGISSVWLLSNHSLISALSDSLQCPGINTDSSTGSGPDTSSVVQLVQWLYLLYTQAWYRNAVKVFHPSFQIQLLPRVSNYLHHCGEFTQPCLPGPPLLTDGPQCTRALSFTWNQIVYRALFAACPYMRASYIRCSFRGAVS